MKSHLEETICPISMTNFCLNISHLPQLPQTLSFNNNKLNICIAILPVEKCFRVFFPIVQTLVKRL